MLDNVIILALGPSWYKCPEKVGENEEIWCVNTMYRNRPADRIFIMHDLRHDILLMDKDFIHNVNQLDVPVYTAGDYPAFKNNVEYPIEEVIKEFNVAFFLNVMCYMIALAIKEGAKKITMFGSDMRSEAGHEYRMNEKGSVEFWLGVAIGRDIAVALPEESYLLKRTMTGNFYGYTPRQEPNGLLYLIPENIRRDHHSFRLTPLDRDGNDLKEYSVTTRLIHDKPELID